MTQNLGIGQELAYKLIQLGHGHEILLTELSDQEIIRYAQLRDSAHKANTNLYESWTTCADPEHLDLIGEKRAAERVLDDFLNELLNKKRPKK